MANARFLDDDEKALLKHAAEGRLRKPRGMTTKEFDEFLDLLNLLSSPCVDVRVEWNAKGDKIIPRLCERPTLEVIRATRK